MTKKTLMTVLFAALTACPALAECYREEITPAGQLVCGMTDSNSADFTNGCTVTTEPTVKRVPVACGKMWVQAPAHWRPPSQGGICGFYGMAEADFNGVKCASAALQPKSGLGWESINPYHFDGPPRGIMGYYPVHQVGGSYIYYGSLHSGAFCSRYPRGQGETTKWVVAQVCMQQGKVN